MAPRPTPLALSRWLLIVAALVVCIVAVGGITRLTESGLSITEWKPISGIVPPLTDASWQAAFDKYRATPEYQQINRGMTLDQFQFIFFWEYLHRLLGRIIGLAFAVPLAVFWWRGAIPPGYKPRLLALLALGAMQGAIGWWMVQSGLSQRTDVSHIRLAVHLLTALVTMGGLVWTVLDLRALARDPSARPRRLLLLAGLALAGLGLQLVLGAFTAGLDAGYAFASWPLMGDAVFPAAGWRAESTVAANLIDNPVVVQFVHRWFAFAAAALLIWLAARTPGGWRTGPGLAIVVLVVGQIGLGIATLLSGVEITVAVLHQVNAALLVAATVTAAHRLASRR